MSRFDAVVVGSGPNGLAAAITIAEEGHDVLLVEGADEIGGGARTAELTLPGFRHDVCSAIHPTAVASRFLRSIPLEQHGLEWVYPPASVAHPLDGARAAVLQRSVEETAGTLGEDQDAYRRLFGPIVRRWDAFEEQLLSPLLSVPRYPILMAKFGLRAIRSARSLVDAKLRTEEARGLFGGLAAHGILPLDDLLTASFGLVFGGTAHAVGWPFPKGGSHGLARGLAAHFEGLGGQIETGRWITRLEDLPEARAYLLDVGPHQLSSIAGDHLPGRYRGRLQRFRYGPGVFKVDFALDGPVPWAASGVERAGTVHVGGTFEEVAAAEEAVGRGKHPERPFVLVAQQSLFDPTRAPEGRHTLWTYCHVPNGSTVDMTEQIEGQIERFAPGFRDRILARSVMGPADFERYNPNLVGGDIGGGSHGGLQLVARPVLSLVPYATPNPSIYLCSSSTPPGAGVHGLCGHFAAKAALRRRLG